MRFIDVAFASWIGCMSAISTMNLLRYAFLNTLIEKVKAAKK